VVAALAKALAGELPIIAAGGITDGAKAQAKLDAGASLIQLYSGLIYKGPALIQDCVRATI
jgi:dihydroorotate dehydrogenase